jgi:hypothetical protein
LQELEAPAPKPPLQPGQGLQQATARVNRARKQLDKVKAAWIRHKRDLEKSEKDLKEATEEVHRAEREEIAAAKQFLPQLPTKAAATVDVQQVLDGKLDLEINFESLSGLEVQEEDLKVLDEAKQQLQKALSEAVQASYGALQARIDEHKARLADVVERARKKRKAPEAPAEAEAAGSGGGAPASAPSPPGPDPGDGQRPPPQPAAAGGSGSLDPQQARLEREVEALVGGYKASAGQGGGTCS